LFNTNSAIFNLYHGENKLIFNEILMVYTQNVCTCCIVVVGTHSRRFLL